LSKLLFLSQILDRGNVVISKRFCWISVCLMLAGCVSTEQVRFKASTGQTALIREGRPAVSSVGLNTIVLLSRTGRDIPLGQRVGFVVAMNSRSGMPQDFLIRNIDVVQTFPDRSPQPIEVLTVEKLQREEQTRQIIGAILVGVAAGANSASASRAGYYRSTTNIYTPRGSYVATTSGYSPVANAIAQGNAAVQNAAMVDAAVAQGQANIARLENGYIKDHTVLQGEWYGGVVGIEPPAYANADEVKTYSITLRVGGDVHRFDVVQEPVKRQ
jgi:hypothetical protein